MSAPGIAWVLGSAIASEIGDIHRFASPAKLAGHTGLRPRVYRSGSTDRRGHLTHSGPKYLRWALMDAATHACRHPVYRDRYQKTKRRLGKQRGAKVAHVDLGGGSPRRSGTCSHVINPSLRYAPRRLWPHRRPLSEMRHTHTTWSSERRR
jgi:transposase